MSYIIEKAKKMPAYAALVFNKHYGDWLIKHKKFKKISYCPADIFFLQVKDGEFRRPDMIVRHLAIDNYYGNNDFGFDLYAKLQDTRVKQGYSAEAVKKFRALIESYEKNGYDPGSYILTDKQLKLRDGSHRMAMATYLNLPEITVAVFNATTALVLDYKWLLDHGFDKAEVDILRRKAEQLQQSLNTPLECVVQDSSKAQEIAAKLEKHGQVLSCETKALTASQRTAFEKNFGVKLKADDIAVIRLKLDEPAYLPLKFAQQPVFKQTAAAKANLGSMAKLVTIPDNFRDNFKIREIIG